MKKPYMPWLKCLTEARKRIESGHNVYICHAIFSVLHKAGHHHLVDTYQSRVEKQLAGYDTYGAWLAAKHPGFASRGGVKTQEDLVPGRLAWLDNMIKIEKERLSK